MYKRFIEQETQTFTRGQYEGKTIQEVAESGEEGIGYLYFIMDHSSTDRVSRAYVAEWLEMNPEFQEE